MKMHRMAVKSLVPTLFKTKDVLNNFWRCKGYESFNESRKCN